MIGEIKGKFRMKSALTDDQIAAYLRKTANELFDIAVVLTSRFSVTGPQAEAEQDSLERIVKALKPCMTPPMPPLAPATRPPSPRPLELTPTLLRDIGLRHGDSRPMIAEMIAIDAQSLPQPWNGAESIVTQAERQGAESDAARKMRTALAKLAVIRRYLQIPRQ
jgi:hypothetical protein